MIDVKTIKELRDLSGSGLQDCKNALEKFNGNMDKAFDHLRNAGMINISSRDERENNEGFVFQASAGKIAVMIHLACETDFAANSRQFGETGEKMLEICLGGDSQEESEKKCLHAVTDLKLLLQENLELKGLEIFNALENENIFMYRHHTRKAGSMLKYSHSGVDNDEIRGLILDIALHTAAEKPCYISEAEISSGDHEKLTRECSIEFDKLEKPEEMREKIIKGMVRKKLKNQVLLNQAFIKDENVTIKELVEGFNKRTGCGIQITDAAWLSVT